MARLSSHLWSLVTAPAFSVHYEGRGFWVPIAKHRLNSTVSKGRYFYINVVLPYPPFNLYPRLLQHFNTVTVLQMRNLHVILRNMVWLNCCYVNIATMNYPPNFRQPARRKAVFGDAKSYSRVGVTVKAQILRECRVLMVYQADNHFAVSSNLCIT
jgi:hypothetical protein